MIIRSITATFARVLLNMKIFSFFLSCSLLVNPNLVDAFATGSTKTRSQASDGAVYVMSCQALNLPALLVLNPSEQVSSKIYIAKAISFARLEIVQGGLALLLILVTARSWFRSWKGYRVGH